MDTLALVVDGYRGASAAALCACLCADDDSVHLMSDVASTALGTELVLGSSANEQAVSTRSVRWDGALPETVCVGDLLYKLSSVSDVHGRTAELVRQAFAAVGLSEDHRIPGTDAVWLVACAAWFAVHFGVTVYCGRLVGRPAPRRMTDPARDLLFHPHDMSVFKGVPVLLRSDALIHSDIVALLKSFTSFDLPPALEFSNVTLGSDDGGTEMAVYFARRVPTAALPDQWKVFQSDVDHPPTHWMVEANIDDMNPEWATHLIPRLLAVGADEAYLTPVHMKKGRIGLLLSVLCPKERLTAVESVIFKETTSIGLRYYEVRKRALHREFVTVATPFGPIRVKIAYYGDRVVNRAPEYEDARRAAEAAGVPVKAVYEAVYREVDGYSG
ncbi:nickel pincer cofactor biosynthesis protein LarC2 [Alicyclobacillus vulcanalis]|uniref:TIGR00299 family protein n=1 Tax=Alicyclobacillus vulcanalis TaxID=252246 RepID=A0A1N7N7L0_9BACL|nr:nickel insertion protein [Alicyclobacillus vulcanalis]SIS94344.1 hypothetical protein SAMN05421799_107127 [Alicyclobacillus vulcanalis]